MIVPSDLVCLQCFLWHFVVSMCVLWVLWCAARKLFLLISLVLSMRLGVIVEAQKLGTQ